MLDIKVFRNIFTSVFGVKPTEVGLAGEMPTDYSVSGCSTSGNHYSNTYNIRMWAYSPENGFRELRSYVLDTYESADEIGFTAESIFEQLGPDELFVVENYKHEDRCPMMGRFDYIDTWTIWKRPDFQKVLDERESKDVLRWSSWVS